MQLNNVIRSFEGLPVTFYTHLVSDEFTDTLECESGIPFSDEIARLFYASREGKPFYQRRLFFTVCFNPHTGIERATMTRIVPGVSKGVAFSAGVSITAGDVCRLQTMVATPDALSSAP